MHTIRLAAVAVAASACCAAGAQTVYASRASFVSAAPTLVTDDYQTGYTVGAALTDSQMSAVKRLTQYTATGNPNLNYVFAPTAGTQAYCAGCNGSFALGFTTAAFSGAGTRAVGFDYLNVPTFVSQATATPYFAFVVFANATTASYALQTQAAAQYPVPAFFGITSALPILEVRLGLADGAATQLGGFVIDNLSVTLVPEPATAALLLAGLAATAAAAVRQRRRG